MNNTFLRGVQAIAISALCLVSSCSNDTTSVDTVNEAGTLELEFDNVVGIYDLQLATQSYTNSSGESFTIDNLKYYISNVVLIAADGSKYTLPEPQQYHLIDEAKHSNTTIELSGIPANTYTSIQFVIGVDSVKSVSPIEERTGALDPASGAAEMYWTWNSGYIFFKLEGVQNDSAFMYHIGGFGGLNSPTVNNLRTVTLPLSSGIRVDAKHENAVHLIADIAEVFNGPVPMSIEQHRVVMFDAYSTTISANYSTMFSVDHIHSSTHE